MNIKEFLKAIVFHRWLFLNIVLLFAFFGACLIYFNSQQYQFSQIIRLGQVMIPNHVDAFSYSASLWTSANKTAAELQKVYVPLAYQEYLKVHPNNSIHLPVVDPVNLDIIKSTSELIAYGNYGYLILKVIDHRKRQKEYENLFQTILQTIHSEENRRKDKIIEIRMAYLDWVKKIEQLRPVPDSKKDNKNILFSAQNIHASAQIQMLKKFNNWLEPSVFVTKIEAKRTMTFIFGLKLFLVFVWMGIVMASFVVWVVVTGFKNQ